MTIIGDVSFDAVFEEKSKSNNVGSIISGIVAALAVVST